MPLRKLGRSASSAWNGLYTKHHVELFEDKVMTAADWAAHKRETHMLRPVELLRVMLGYVWLLVCVACISVMVGVYDCTLVQHHGFPMLQPGSVTAFFSATTFALTLLLVFKTNSCYARWWEARKMVGQLVSFSHNISRQAVTYFPPHQADLLHALGRFTASAMFAVKSLVRPHAVLKEELEGTLMPDELTWLLAQPQRPLAVAQAISLIVQAADISAEAKSRMDTLLTQFTSAISACGRLYNTAIPAGYTRHTSRFLMVYIFLGLPLLMWPVCRWASPVPAVLISFLLLGIENIGGHIEEPFNVIAFDTFCASVRRDIFNIISMAPAQRDGPAPGGGKGSPPVICGLTAAPPPAGAMQDAAAAAAAAAAATAAAAAAIPRLKSMSLPVSAVHVLCGRSSMRHEQQPDAPAAGQQRHDQRGIVQELQQHLAPLGLGQHGGHGGHRPVRASDSRTFLLAQPSGGAPRSSES